MLINWEVARELQWFPLCNVNVQFNCWPLKGMWASLFLKISLMKFPGWAGAASSWLIWTSKGTRRAASLDCHWVWNAEGALSVSLKCSSQITAGGNPFPESSCTGCVVLSLSWFWKSFFRHWISDLQLSTQEHNHPCSWMIARVIYLWYQVWWWWASVMLPRFSCWKYHKVDFEGIHLLAYKNNSHSIFFLVVFSCAFWLGAILFLRCRFPPNHQGYNISKMKKQKCRLRGFGGFVCLFFIFFFLLKFLDSRCWIFEEYIWNLEPYNEISGSRGYYCWPTARDQLISVVACVSHCCETSSKSPLSMGYVRSQKVSFWKPEQIGHIWNLTALPLPAADWIQSHS